MKGDELPFNNSNLFSNHFLEKRLKDFDEWKVEENLEEKFDEIKRIYEKEKELLRVSEHSLENKFIIPILKILGHQFELQVPTKDNRIPDYCFFVDKNKMINAIENKDKEDPYKFSIAVGDAKAWGTPLDKRRRGKNVFENSNPSFQIFIYLLQTSAKWGILTNGKKWRLYFQKTSEDLETFYEVDLEEIIKKDDLETFKYFYFFFRLDSFLPRDNSFLNRIYDKSVKYSESIGKDLEGNIYKALKWMAHGFLSLGSNNLSEDRKNIKDIHDNSLIFLYRLLFVLYANSLGIIKPPKKKIYEHYNVDALLDEILGKLDKDEVPHGALYWTRFEEIFAMINRGSVKRGIPKEEFFVPAYNGGLFDTEKHSFLKDNKINDRDLAKVIDLLVRRKSDEHKGRGRIDYSDLSVRHLGGIYEGLLEYKLKIAKEDLVAIKEKGKQVWIPKSKVENKKIYDEVDEGEVYLVTDKGERKATGSYYTPDYIVKYIVRNTIGPVIKDKIKGLNTNKEKRGAILSIKVLDPAMGSGHFLVEATDFLARELSKYIEGGNGEETDKKWAKREIAKRCIYGVDLNPLAVELAKVSLWLYTLSKNKPLSFLNHHLRTGNSLIGADIKKMGRHPTEEVKKKNNLWSFFGKDFNKHMDELLGLYRELMKVRGENIDDIRKQEELYHNLRTTPFRKRFGELANLYTSYYFDNKFSKQEYQEVLSELKKGGDWKKVSQLDSFGKAQKLAKEKNFFHWKLEFLEVFFDLKKGEKDNPGFDVVIGNPPWGAKFNKEDNIFLRIKYPEVTKMEKDSYETFVNLAFNLLRKKGNFGFIIPNTLFRRQGHKDTRFFLLKNVNITNLVDLGENIFKEVTMPSCIITFSKVSILSKINCINLTGIKRNQLHEKLSYSLKGKLIHQEVFEKMIDNKFLIGASENELDLLTKFQNFSFKLRDVLESLSEGLKTGDNKVFLSENKMKVENDLQKKCIKGSDIKRYAIINFRYLLNSNIVNETEHPKAWDYLKIKKNRLKERSLVKKNKIKWYQLNEDRIDDVSKSPKIVLRETEDEIIATPEINGLTALKTTFVLIPKRGFDVYFLSGILNSLLIKKYYFLITAEEGRTFARVRASDLKSIPVVPNKNEGIAEYVERIFNLKRKSIEESASFLNWVSREWEVDIEDLSPKSYLKEYWKYDFKEMLRVAKRNKSKIKGNPSSRKFQETLEKEWKKSVNKLKPLLEEIQDLDNQIDAIVFKLYDLTEDEMITVLDSLGTEDEIKEDILIKFRELK